MIAIVLLEPVMVTLAVWLYPMLPEPVPPRMLFVATRLPVVDEAAPTFTPWLVDPEPPWQLLKVKVPLVPAAQADPIFTPCELAELEVLAPLKLIGPSVLVMPLAVPMLIPKLEAEPEAVPFKMMEPFVLVIVPPPMLIP